MKNNNTASTRLDIFKIKGIVPTKLNIYSMSQTPNKLGNVEDLLGNVYVLDAVLKEFETLIYDYPFLRESEECRALESRISRILDEERITEERVEELHREIVEYLGAMESDGGLISLDEEGHQEFIIPESLKNLEGIKERVHSEKKDSRLLEAKQSAVNMIILGELVVDQIILTHCLAVRKEVMAQLRETQLDQEEFEGDVTQEVNAYFDEIWELLQVKEDEELMQNADEYGVGIVTIILKARADIRGKEFMSPADDSLTVMKEEAQKITSHERGSQVLEGSNKRPLRIRRENLEEHLRRNLFPRLTPLEESVFRMRYGISEGKDFQLEVRGQDDLELSIRIARIEAAALEKLTGKKIVPTRIVKAQEEVPEEEGSE